MDIHHLIHDVQACVGDGEWERAEIYLGDVRTTVESLLHGGTTPRGDGAMLQTLRGLEFAVQQHQASAAFAALRHLAWLAGDGARAA